MLENPTLFDRLGELQVLDAAVTDPHEHPLGHDVRATRWARRRPGGEPTLDT